MTISIIIPVYLSELFLNKNFENVRNQSYKNLEIIYVNDGSPDSSGFMCDKFALLDKRVKVVHQKNSGPAEALNIGISNSTGNYVMFLDADDWIELNTCELAINIAISKNIDMVFWLNIKEYLNKSIPVKSFFNKSKEFRIEEMSFLRRRMIGLVNTELSSPMQTDAFNAGWGKLYRSEVIKKSGIKWTDTNYVGSSDVLFNTQLMPYVKSAFYLDEYLHHYNRINPNSLTKTYNDTLRKKFSHLFREINNVIEVNYSKSKDYNLFLEALDNRIALSTINIGLGYVKNGMNIIGLKKFKALVSSIIYQKPVRDFQIKYLPLHFRVFFFFCKHSFFIPAYFLLYLMQKLR
jgi:glycosyltransferase EpsH